MEYEFVISGRKADILCPSPDHLLDSFALLPLLFRSSIHFASPFRIQHFFLFFNKLSNFERSKRKKKKKLLSDGKN